MLRSVCGLAIWLTLFSLAGACPAAASLTAHDLAGVRVNTPGGAREALGAVLTDERGRPITLGEAIGGPPGLLVFADYRCTTLCGPALSILAAGIDASGIKPGRDATLVVVGLDPSETVKDATAFRDARLAPGSALRTTSRFLIADAAAIQRLTRAVGYGYIRVPSSRQYIHPVAAFVLSPDGAVSSVLSEIGMGGPAVARAVDAARGQRTLSFADRLGLICHGLTPLTGAYDGAAMAGLRVVSLLALLGAGVLAIRSFRRRRAG